MRRSLLAVCALAMAACTDSGPSPSERPPSADPSVSRNQRSATSAPRTIRLSGTLEAVRSVRVVVPQLSGPLRNLTLTRLVANGAVVEAGDIVAEFDPIEQIDQARQSRARFEDLGYQVRQKEAENAANRERRRSELEQAEADLAKARLDVSKAEVLGEVEAEQNLIRAAQAEGRVDSLRRSQPEQERIDQAQLRVLELQRERERSAFESAQANLEKLRVRAPLSGMVALSTRYSNGSMVQPQEGDQMNSRNTLMSIFDPSEMSVRASVAEPDGALIHPGLEVAVFVDAYPDLSLPARFLTASPIAAGSLGTPVRSFAVTFRLEESDPRLMPDLSAAVVFEVDRTPSDIASLGPGTGQ